MDVKEDENQKQEDVSRWSLEVGTLYDLVNIGPRIVFQEARFLPVEQEMVLRIQDAVGLSVEGYRYTVDTDGLRHIIKRHTGTRELLRGQIPLVRDDFFLLPQVFGIPDIIENAGKTKSGRDTIRYRLKLGAYRYAYIEELRTKKNRLAAVTY